jgi:hypothetical protein
LYASNILKSKLKRLWRGGRDPHVALNTSLFFGRFFLPELRVGGIRARDGGRTKIVPVRSGYS